MLKKEVLSCGKSGVGNGAMRVETPRAGRKISSRWRAMPATIFLMGVFSIVLLFSSAWLTSKQHNNFLIEDMLMDVQIRVASFHLRLEEHLRGDAIGVDDKDIWRKLEEAIGLVDASLDGGPSEHGQMIEPVRDPQFRAKTEDIRSLLVEFRMIALTLMKGHERAGSGSLTEERFHAIYKAILGKASALERVLEEENIQDQKKAGRLFRAILFVWVIIVTVATAGLWYHEKGRKKAEEELLKANDQLRAQAEELAEHRVHLSELVEDRTADLKTANELLRGEMSERLQACEMLKETEKQNRHLSDKLINAQEIERKRLSMGLHDELGQALSVMKLRMRGIEKGLREDQEVIRQDCEGLLKYVDQVIEEVRRLSLDLSPTVLEDLGLTAALQWLIRNLSKIPAMKVTSDIVEIDHLFPRYQWITIYRVFQEALTNITKHARAANVSIAVRPTDDKVTFSVEDDGKGLDLTQASIRDITEKGFGLTTMNERVNAMGGVFDLWSGEGKGTRITFSIPRGRGEE